MVKLILLDEVVFFGYDFYMDEIRKIAKVHGFPVDLLDYEGVISKSFDYISKGLNAHIITINPEIIQSAKKKHDLSEIIKNAEIVTPDGVGIKYALKMKGVNQNQVTGVDLSVKMLQKCAEKNVKVALIGAKEEILNLAIKNIKKENPNIDIAYAHNGYFQDFEPIIQEIVNSGAKFILCAMGSPRQEYFIYQLKQKIQGAVMIGVGGTFDVLSGVVKLAPSIYRKLGLEWLYRTVCQPERFKRIFPTLPIFFFQSIIDSVVSKD